MPFTSVEEIGFERGERSLIFRQFARRVGVLSKPIQIQVEILILSIEQVEALVEALLDA
jgi:Domain of unknown function (DUF4351)